MIARRLVIHGRVQGVWYRSWAVRAARELGVSGWVRNRRDGTVEAQVEGEPEAVEAFEERCHEGPPKARIERIEGRDAEYEGAREFQKRKTA